MSAGILHGGTIRGESWERVQTRVIRGGMWREKQWLRVSILLYVCVCITSTHFGFRRGQGADRRENQRSIQCNLPGHDLPPGLAVHRSCSHACDQCQKMQGLGGGRQRPQNPGSGRMVVGEAVKEDQRELTSLRWSEITPWKLVLADGAATCVERCLTYPLDLLRTRIQTDVSSKQVGLLQHMLQVTKRTWLEGWNQGIATAEKRIHGGRLGSQLPSASPAPLAPPVPLAPLAPIAPSARASGGGGSVAQAVERLVDCGRGLLRWLGKGVRSVERVGGKERIEATVGRGLGASASTLQHTLRAYDQVHQQRAGVLGIHGLRLYGAGLLHAVKGLYRGFGFSTALQIPSNMIYLCMYLAVKDILRGWDKQQQQPVKQSPHARSHGMRYEETVVPVLEQEMRVRKRRTDCAGGRGAVTESREAAGGSGVEGLVAMLAAMLAETAVAVIQVPHDVITQKIQVEHVVRSSHFERSWRRPVRGLEVFEKQLATQRGWASLYVGTSAHLLASVPWSAAWWGSYEATKLALHRFLLPLSSSSSSPLARGGGGGGEGGGGGGHAELRGAIAVVAGMTAGLVAAAVSNPIDVIKTRKQLDAMLHQQPILSIARSLMEREGPQALFKGLALAILFDVVVSSTAGLRFEFVTAFAAAKPTHPAAGGASLALS